MPKKTEKQKHLAGEIHPLVGVAHGHVDENGETIVYEHGEDGEFIGWHKDPEGGPVNDPTVLPRGPEGWGPEEEANG